MTDETVCRTTDSGSSGGRLQTKIGEFGCRRLLLNPSGVVLHLWRIAGRVGYLEKHVRGIHRWVWLDPELLERTRPYHGPAIAGVQPELQLDERKPKPRNNGGQPSSHVAR